ncbi:phosphatidylethanolamine [Acrasis kona]|uniref:Phosphatidylethanolamine N-methyltransferase n=1 Tax=Acrasis kona TaxID=1008807 RepID=A0AAW2ZJ55_9EUKA
MLWNYVDFSDKDLQYAAIVIVLCPLIWNILARLEYYTRLITKISFGNPYIGCYLLATWIFCFSIYRDILFTRAVNSQKKHSLMLQNESLCYYLGHGLIGIGGVFVLSSMYRLGVTGTYLGDYFGILMDQMVRDFPFNVMNNPMYDGASLCFLGQAIAACSPAGLLLSLEVFVVYRVALRFEGPFTTFIYSQRKVQKTK